MHFYRDVVIPAGATNVQLRFSLRMPTVDNTYDYLRVYTTSTSNTPVSGTVPGAGYVQRFINTATAYANFTAIGPIGISGVAGTTMRLVFTFTSDGVTPHANPAIDDVQVSMNCILPTATFNVIENCAANNYTVNANVTSFGYGTTGTLAYSVNGGAPSTQSLTGLGTVSIGPFPSSSTVVASVSNSVPSCGATSSGSLFSNCPITLPCGTPLEVQHCYGNLETRTFTYIAPPGESITLTFIQGAMGPGDVIRAYSGTSNLGMPIMELTGNFPQLPPASGVSLGNELFLEIESTASGSCADGQYASWVFEVKCTPLCQSPDGSVLVNTNCAASNYTLDVEVFFLGDGTSTTLWYSVDGGTPQTIPGLVEFDVESIGPFALTSTVNVRLLHENQTACDRNLGNFTRDQTCPPVNEICGLATELFLKTPAQCPSQATAGTTFDAVNEIVAPGCDGTGAISDVWYHFNSGFNQSPILISVAAGTIGHWGVEVYTGCGGTLVGCVPGSPAGVNLSNPAAYTDYWVRVFTNASLGAPGSFTICVSATPLASSCGSVIRDPGGTGNYANNQNVTNTYCPTNAGEVLTMTFTEFNTESGWDFVRVYNGPTTASPLLGTFSGTAIPGPFTSTHPSGCLTVNFTSDISNVAAGYTANLTCCVAPAPTLNLSSNGPVCSGNDLQLNCDAGTVFSWTGPNGFSSSVQNPLRTGMSAAEAGTYSVTARNGVNGCPTTATIDVVVSPAPGMPSITPPAPVACAGEPTLLTGTASSSTLTQTVVGGAITINASGNATPYGSTINVSGLPATGSTLFSVQVNGFSHTWTNDVDMVLVSPTGTAVILMSDVGGGNSIAGRNFLFRDGFPAMGTGTLASGTYRCSSPDGPDNFPAPGPGSLNQTNPLLSAFAGDPNGVWRLFVVDDAAGDAGSITSWSITFNYSDGLTWTWAPNTALSSTTGASVTASPTTTITYTATVASTTSGCSRSTEVTVTVNPLPEVTCGGPYGPYCIDNGVVTLSGAPAGGMWSGPGVTGVNFDPASAGVGGHVLTYTYADGNGCANECTTTIVVNALPVVDAGTYGPYCSVELPVTLTGAPAGGAWSGTGVSGASFDPASGTATLTYTFINGNGCANSAQTIITVNTATPWYADQDGDGFGDPGTMTMACSPPNGHVANTDDTCPLLFGQNGDACNAGPNFVLGQIVNCACVGQQCTTDLIVEFQTDGNGFQNTWELRTNGTNIVVQSGGGWYPGGAVITDNTCLPDGCYHLRVFDAGGDGMANGGYILRTASGQRIIDNRNNFTNGSVSAVIGNGGFCLPLGTDKLIYTSCDKLDWVNDQYIVAAPNPAVSAQWGTGDQTDDGYQFWIFDPNGTYGYTKFRNHATSDGFGPANAVRACHARINNWSPNQIPANVLMNVKVRSRVNGANSNWGPVCRFKIDPVRAACPLTKLMDIPGNQFFSCGVTRTWGGSSRINARPVDGATQYQFRFENGELPGGSLVRNATTYYLNLNWTPALPNGTYRVQVRAFKNGAWCVTSLPWGDECNVTITGSTAMALNGGNTTSTGDAKLAMFPNPNNGEQLTVSLSAVEEGVETISVDIFDLSGARVSSRTMAVNDGMVYQVLSLGEMADGLYMVNITAGTQRYTERLVISK
jgi:hypothetical protein